MSKTKEELDALKEEVEAVNEKLQELTPEEIAQINGGCAPFIGGKCGLVPVSDEPVVGGADGKGVPVLPGFEPGVTAAGAEFSGHVRESARPAL